MYMSSKGDVSTANENHMVSHLLTNGSNFLFRCSEMVYMQQMYMYMRVCGEHVMFCSS